MQTMVEVIHIHQKLDSLGEEIEAQVKKYREELIISEILSTEVLTNSMMLWLADLPKHDYIIHPESETMDNKSPLAMARNVANDAIAKAKGEPVKEELKGDKEEDPETKVEEELEPEEEIKKEAVA